MACNMLVFYIFFFFQAEDGIRDLTVTGVQTCALPISATISPANSWPMTSGGLRRPCAQASHSAMCRSVPHTPAWRTAISTSPGPADGLGTVATLRPGAGRSFRMACMAGSGKRKREGAEDGAGETPVHPDHGARDIAGAFRGEEHDGRGELVGAAHAAHREFRDHLPHHFLGAAGLPLRPGPGAILDPF